MRGVSGTPARRLSERRWGAGEESVPLCSHPDADPLCLVFDTRLRTEPSVIGSGGLPPRTAVWVESRAGGTAVSVVSPPRPTLFSRGDANDVFCVPTGRGSTSRYRVTRPTAVRSMSSHWVRLPSSPAHEPPDERGRSSCEPNMSLNRTVTESSSAGTLVPASGHQKHSRSMTEIRQAFFHSACHW